MYRSRRHVLGSLIALATGQIFGFSGLIRPAQAQTKEAGIKDATPHESHGLSTFGDLALPADFPHFSYVNPQAPKGGLLSIQLRATQGNQNPETFDTLNIYCFEGDGAPGMDMCHDSLMTSCDDEPSSFYGLLAQAVRWSDDRRLYRFTLRPQARFHDGSPVTAVDVAFSIYLLKEQGHPTFRLLLRDLAEVQAEDSHTLLVRLAPQHGRDLILMIAGLPVFSQAFWHGRDFHASLLEAPLASGPWRLCRYDLGHFTEFERVRDYWGADLPVNRGLNNFDRIRYTCYRDRVPAFEDFKAGKLNFNEEFTARLWATAYDFPAMREGKVKKESLPNGAPVPIQGWYINTRRAQFRDSRIRQALNYCFDFEWTNATIMFSTYKRLDSFFGPSLLRAQGKPTQDELRLLEPWRGRIPDAVFDEPFVPPVSDGSGADRILLRKADALLKDAGCIRRDGVLYRPDGSPFTIEFLDSNPALQPHTEPFQANLRRLGITSSIRLVDSAQYRRRLDAFDYDMVTMAMGNSLTPGDELRLVYESQAASTLGTRNMAGIADPAVDALIDSITHAGTRTELEIACRCLDRLLRAGFYWIPMWYRDRALLAFWDVFDRPTKAPRYGTGAPSTWWWNEQKAQIILKV